MTEQIKRPRGRPKKVIEEVQIQELVNRGYTFKEIAEHLDVSVSYIVKVWSKRIWDYRSK